MRCLIADSVVSRPANKLRPNTRFLRNIIQGTKHHNDTLLAKEAAESQTRLQELKKAEEAKRRKFKPAPGEIRSRQLGNITALLQGGGPKRKRPTEDGATDLTKARAEEDARRVADIAALRRRDKDGKRKRSLERYNPRKDKGRDGADSEAREYLRRNSSSDEEDRSKKERKRKDRSRSPTSSHRKHRHRSPLRGKDKDEGAKSRSGHSHHRRTETSGRSREDERTKEEAEDSDALEDLIGPAPPPKATVPRGRGALQGSSGIDNRFSDGYDPKSDIEPPEKTGNDWDDALEALKDRNRWRQQGADRLRAAGFTEDQVKKWEKGDEKNIDDVRWSKAGEQRAWDKGKKVEQD